MSLFLFPLQQISYAVDMGMTKDEGSALIMVLGGTSAFARLLFGKVLSFQFLKRRELHQLSMMITATATMMVTISKGMGGFIVYVIVLGLVDGCNVVLLPLLTRSYAGDCNVPIAWGMLNGVSSITFILGPPVAGELLVKRHFGQTLITCYLGDLMTMYL